jgi:leader peptidase (prepilin peptidase)/N-methyltransferase
MSEIGAYLASHPLTFATIAAVFGLAIGSFLNVVILRLPVMLERDWRAQCAEIAGNPLAPQETFSLATPRSRCPHCGHAITALENIPVLSFLWLRGKCSACGQPISWRYPLIELATALLTFVVAWRFGFGVQALTAAALTWTLIALAVIDYDTQLLPDNITLPLAWAGLLLNLNGTFAPLRSAVIGAVAGYVSLWLVYQLFKLVTGKEGMGFGDFKLFAALGAWLGWTQLPVIILLASFTGAAVGLFLILGHGMSRHKPIPFGPYLCAAGWVAMLWGHDLVRGYLEYARLG